MSRSRQRRDYNNYTPEQRKRMAMRRKRMEERRRRERQKMVICGIGVFIFILILIGGISALRKGKDADETVTSNDQSDGYYEMDSVSGDQISQQQADYSNDPFNPNNPNGINAGLNTNPESNQIAAAATLDSSAYQFAETDATSYMGSPEVTSTYSILTDLGDNHIVAQKNAKDRINPASMTKILTLLVACEHVTNLDDTFTMTIEITDFAYSHDCSSVGFLDGEVVTVKDLLYGTILPSGGDAAVGLATYVAGSHEAFVDMMNQKLSDLGIADTAHFTNCVGLYDENHYCTTYDMAVILEAAMKNELCRQVLNERTYTTSLTEQHPEGITVSNWFLRRIEDKDMGGSIIGAKTGYVVQSGNCAASCYKRDDGTEFICVTADAHSGWRAIYDHVAVYNIYAAGNTGYTKQ